MLRRLYNRKRQGIPTTHGQKTNTNSQSAHEQECITRKWEADNENPFLLHHIDKDYKNGNTQHWHRSEKRVFVYPADGSKTGLKFLEDTFTFLFYIYFLRDRVREGACAGPGAGGREEQTGERDNPKQASFPAQSPKQGQSLDSEIVT